MGDDMEATETPGMQIPSFLRTVTRVDGHQVCQTG